MPSDKPIFFKPEVFHEVYLHEAKQRGITLREGVDVPYEQLSDEMKWLDIALAEHCTECIQPLLQAMEIMREALEQIEGRICNPLSMNDAKLMLSDTEVDAREALKKCDEIFSSKDNK